MSYLHLTNHGGGVARGLTLSMVPLEQGDVLLLENELKKLPVDLASGDTISIGGGVAQGDALEYEAVIRWVDPDGTPQERKRRIDFR